MTLLYLYEHKHVSNPFDERVKGVEDTTEDWEQLLGAYVEEIGDDEKAQAPVLCGAQYFEGSINREKQNIEGVSCLVLDVDAPGTAGRVPNEDELRHALDGVRAIVYASPSHTKESPRWRVLLPLKKLLPPRWHRSLVSLLSVALVPGFEGCINVSSTGDPGRLGFVGVTKKIDDYVWWEQAGEYFDWRGLPLEEETWSEAPLGGIDGRRSALWSDRETALRAALKHFAMTGQGLKKGEGRSDTLWKAANHLWWAYAAEDEDFVMTVLTHINTNFAEPEDEENLLLKIKDAHDRAVGPGRVAQSNGTYGWAREPTSVVTWQALQSYARRLKHRRDPEQALVGEALLQLKKGLTLTDSKQSDAWPGLVTKCAHYLAKGFPGESAEKLAEFFQGSLRAMRVLDVRVPSDQEVTNFIAARLEGIRRSREAAQNRADSADRERIEFVTSGARSSKYTRDEIEAWESVGLRSSTWILVNKKSYYVFRNGTWVGPYTDKEFAAQGYKDLAAATDFVRTQTFSEKKEKFVNVPVDLLLHEYGSKCRTRIDLSCERSYYDVDTHTLVLSGPQRVPLEAKFHVEVDKWLRVGTGRAEPLTEKQRLQEAGFSGERDDYDTLYDWLACVVQTDRPCAALYLEGPHSAGKGLFVEGIAKLWGESPVSFEEAFDSNFNDRLAKTPIVWVDEGLSDRIKASVVLRRAVAAREHTIRQKFVDDTKAQGCVRMVFTANGLDLFNKNRERVKREDMEALQLRFVHILMRPEAIKHLEGIYPRQASFVDQCMLAEHALWLNEQRWTAIKARGHRFLVKGRNSNVSDTVATNNEVTSEVCNLICEALVFKPQEWLLVKDGEVFIAVHALKQFMTLMQLSIRVSERDVSQALSGIGTASIVLWHNVKGRSVRMRGVRKDALRAWCNNTAVYDWEDVKQGIDVLSAKTAQMTGATMGGGNA